MTAPWVAPLESLNHPPTELCPHPEWWHAWNPVSTEVEVSMLVAALVKAIQPEHVLEIGSHYGQTTERIALVIRENGHGEFTSLEFNPELAGSARARCWEFLDKQVKIVVINSLEYIPPHPIDFLFIDGQDARADDLEYYLPYLAEHCMVVMHDTDYYLYETDRALRMWKGDHIQIHSPRGLLVMTR